MKMAVRAAGLCKSLLKPFQSLSLNSTSIVLSQKLSQHESIQRSNHNLSLVRNASFFTKLPADKLWKSVTSVSNAGAKKGRGRGGGSKRAKDLNKGQIIGSSGKINMVWPGLSSPVIRGRELVQQQQLPEDTERMTNLIKLRDSMGNFRRLKLSPSERGWSGVKMPGRKIGPPDPVANESFEGFETIVLEFKTLLTMRGGLGRTRKISCLVVTGNRKGLVGFAIGKGRMGSAALKTAKNRAGQKLITVDLYNDHTIYHDFFAMFGKTKIFGHKQAEGYGLQCHRAIKAICQVVGIKDMHAKVEGSHNLQNIIKAFFIALLQQKSHQQMAEEKGLHLVEFRKEHEFFPKVVASPSVVRTENEIRKDEVLDFTRYALDNRVMEKMKKHPPFYTKLPHWQIYLKKYEKRRNHNTIRLNMLTEHGELKSFLTDRYKDEPLEKE